MRVLLSLKERSAEDARMWILLVLLSLSQHSRCAELVLLSRPQPGTGSAMGSSFSGAPQLSRDGRFLLFTSQAGNLTQVPPGQDRLGYFLNLYVQELASGQTRLISVNKSATRGGNGPSTCGSISTDGRYVVFESEASDLVDNDTNGVSDIFIRDLQTGITRLVSLNQAGNGPGNGSSTSPVMTPDGRFVAFESSASDLVAGDTNGIPDVFVRDLQTGTTILASAGSTGVPGTGSGTASISDDGKMIAFLSTAANAKLGVAVGQQQLFARDAAQGATTQISSNSLRKAALPLLGTVSIAAGMGNATLSADGRYVAFKGAGNPSWIFSYDLETDQAWVVATNALAPGIIISDGTGPILSSDGEEVLFAASLNYTSPQIYLWKRTTGRAALVSANRFGQPSTKGSATFATMTPDGRYVAFVSDATDLLPETAVRGFQVYLRDMASNTTRLVSIRSDGSPSEAVENSAPSISDDGRYVAFEAEDDALSLADNNHAIDVFVRDMNAAAAVPVSLANQSQGVANGFSAVRPKALSTDGHRALFSSFADNLVTNGSSGFPQLFTYDLGRDQIALVSINTNGAASAGVPHDQVLSGNGRAVAFLSRATDLVGLPDTNRIDDVFWRDLNSSITELVSIKADGTSAANPVSTTSILAFAPAPPSISDTGNLITFESIASDLIDGTTIQFGPNVFVRDVVAQKTDWISRGLGFPPTYPQLSTHPSLDSAGTVSAFFWSSEEIGLWNIAGKTNELLTFGTTAGQSPDPDSAITIAGSKPRLTFEKVSRSLQRAVYWYDFASGLGGSLTTLADGSETTNTARSKPVISADGRYVAFVSNDDRLGPGDANQNRDIFVSDLGTGTRTLVSVNATGTGSGNGPSDNPAISDDGRYVVFQSDASDLVQDDTNGTTDIFVRDLVNKTTTLLSVNAAGEIGNGPSTRPSISSDGRTVLFQSLASNFAPGDFNQMPDVFLALLDPRPKLGRVQIQGGQILLEVTGTSSRAVAIQASTDLKTWSNVQTNTLSGGTVQIAIPGPALQQQFYRGVEVPAVGP